jgi:hypothetical protein
MRIARSFDLVAHGALVARYRRHDGNMSHDPLKMLPATLTVLERQRPFAVTTARRRALAFGLRRCREFYGEQMVQLFRRALRDRNGRAALGYARHLARLYPRGAVRHLTKKIGLTVRYAGRATPATDTASPISRASAAPGSR